MVAKINATATAPSAHVIFVLYIVSSRWFRHAASVSNCNTPARARAVEFALHLAELHRVIARQNLRSLPDSEDQVRHLLQCGTSVRNKAALGSKRESAPFGLM